ncbi:ArnT family glycosyltransferase [Haliangium sp.]|uniref:ArnT family glycosyltransferase n=1 Tax=Haliangium sp. TaxID=2663208 RepID=UPI003D0E89A3
MTAASDLDRAGPSAPRRLLPLALLFACAATLVWHALQYGFVTDDAYISFVYSRNLAEHGALVFNLGMDPVEGFTNFLWTVLLGALMWLGLDPAPTSIALGIGFGVGTLVLAYRLVDHFLPRVGSGWALVAPALLCTSAGFACWSAGGLETQMFTFWVTASLYAYARGALPRELATAADERRARRWLRGLGVLLALAAMTRPEGLLVAAVLGLHRLVVNLTCGRLWPSRDELWVLGLFLLLWAPWYAWRWWYYGYPFPNTYYVKAAGEPPPGYAEALISGGLYYVWQWARQSHALYASPLLLAGLLWARPGGRRFAFGALGLVLSVAYLVYTVRVGGDFMGLHRFVMPLFVVAAVAAALGLALIGDWLRRRGSGAGARVAVSLVLGLGLVGAHTVGQLRLTHESMRWGNWKADHGIDTPSYLRVYTRDRAAIGRHMRDCFENGDFSIVGGAGAQPYEARMRAIDVFGLVSERIAHEVPPTRPRAGHNKWGPDRLLLEYGPDFVFSCYSIHPRPDAPRFNCNPSFWTRHGYERVTLHIPTLEQQGQYYSFFKRRERAFECPGIVTPTPGGAR